MPRRPPPPSQKLWEASNAEVQRSVNKWSARIVPLVLIGVVGYSVWAIIVVLCLHYLIFPPADVPRRLGAGIAIMVIYFLLMVPMALSYFRVLQTIATNPGFVPRPEEGEKGQRKADRKRQRRLEKCRDRIAVDGGEEEKEDAPYARSHISPETQDQEQEWTGPAPGLEFYYRRDIFECEMDGRPRWCSTCHIWKPDRVHHSSELGKCVYKMDHFCPWAGGIVSETNFKFFIQFCTYAALFCLFLLVVSAYFTAEMTERHHSRSPVISIIAISAFFFTFTGTMAQNSLYFAFLNSTTVDNLTRKTKVYHFAVHVPDSHTPAVDLLPPAHLSAHPNIQPLSQQPPLPPYRTLTYPMADGTSMSQVSSESPRTFAILATPAGGNPYLLATPLENFQTVMGERWFDWFLPIRHSPCWDGGHGYPNGHEHEQGGDDAEKGLRNRRVMYKTGPVVDDMIRYAGLPPLQDRT